MIHKYYQILKNFSGNYQKYIYGRELINKVDISQKNIALTLKELEKEAILKLEQKGNIKFYSLNLKNLNIKDTIAITELTKKTEFLEKHKTLSHIFQNDNRIVGIFGSYAKQTYKPRSDIDVLIIGKRRPKDYNLKAKLFDLNISIKYFTEEQFKRLLNKKNPLMREIIENHILLFNVERFIELIWREYYGFNYFS